MPRAYLRLDPAFDERKHAYPDGAYAALVATFCLAEHQPERGRFRSAEYLSRLLGRRGRWVKYLTEMGDVTILEDGRAYVDGWDEWQEGDVTVKERMSRLRERRNKDRNDVTEPSSHSASAIAQGGGVSGSAGADRRASDPADSYWSLTGKYPTDKTLGWIDQLAERFGTEAVTRALAAAFTADRSVATLLGRTQDILRSEARELDRKEREDEQRRLREKRAKPRVEEPWRIAQREAYLERYGPDAA